MDEYGCFRFNEKDYQELADVFKKTGNIVFPYSEDNSTCIIVSLNMTFTKVGTMPFGGNPSGRIWVSVYGSGCASHLSWQSDENYIQEKLRVNEFTAKWIENILSGIKVRLGDS